MRKIFYLLIIIGLAALNFPAISKEIERVDIVGNVRYNEIMYKNCLDIDYDKKITASQKNKIIKTLFATDLVDDIRVEFKNKILTITVKERPFVRKINFNGNKKLTEEIIKNNLKLKVKEGFSEHLLREDLKFLNNFYRGIGLWGAKIEYAVNYLDNNLAEVTFNIEEGKKALVKSIKFFGNEQFSGVRLREELRSRENKFYRFGSRITYSEDALEYDAFLLSQFYYSKGFINFEIISKNAVYDSSANKFDIIFKLKEGEKYNYGDVKITSEAENFDIRPLKKEFLGFAKNKTFNLADVRRKVEILNNRLNRGEYGNLYLNSQILPDQARKTVNINLTLKHDEKYYVGKIDIVGNNKTYDDVIRRKFLLQEGDILNRHKLDGSMRAIQSLGFFDSATYVQSDGYFDNQRDVKVEVKEGNSGYANFAVGFSTLDGLNGSVGFSQKNLFGQAVGLSVDLTIYETAKVFNFYLNKPEIFDTAMNWSNNIYFSGRNDSENNSINIGYDTFSYGVGNYLSYELTENLTQRVGYVIEFEQFKNVSLDYEYILSSEEKYTSKITNGFRYDRRNNYRDPTDGYFLSHDIDAAGIGGDKDYIKNVFLFSRYYPLASSITFKGEFKVGFINSIGNNPLFPNDGFFLGGYSMRGFRSGGIGPRVKTPSGSIDNGYGVGGTRLYYGNFEIRFPLGLPREMGVYGILFLNMGTVTGIDDNPKVRKDLIVDSGSLRSAYGFSLMWQTPLGNIGFDFSRVLKKESYDLAENFRLNIGTQF
ncbi:MAG: outer membrane protein assembly factor BamA [Rickettsiales bacterium]|jgi:outer membrane protein insertion porin family|nr:outer membrane protein assembly factor BamA [Rickettsiales bacterium]